MRFQPRAESKINDGYELYCNGRSSRIAVLWVLCAFPTLESYVCIMPTLLQTHPPDKNRFLFCERLHIARRLCKRPTLLETHPPYHPPTRLSELMFFYEWVEIALDPLAGLDGRSVAVAPSRLVVARAPPAHCRDPNKRRSLDMMTSYRSCSAALR